MKLLSRLFIALLICLVALPVLVIPRQAEAADISLSEGYGYVGDEIRVTGSLDGDEADIYYCYNGSKECELVKEGEEVDNGTLRYTLTIPESCKGRHLIVVDPSGSVNNESEDFIVKPKVEVTYPGAEEGFVEDKVKVRGTGFDAWEEDLVVRYYRDETDYVEFDVTDAADEYGTWRAEFYLPDSPRGEHDIGAEGSTTDDAEVKEAIFTTEPMIKLSPASGFVGDIVTVIGTGFEAEEEDIKIRYDGEEVEQIEEAVTDEFGSWSATFEVPSGAKGDHEVDARGRDTEYSEVDDASFRIGPGIKIIPPTSSTSPGHVGQTLTVTGGGFDPDIPITVTYAGEAVEADTDRDGNLPEGITFKAEGPHGAQEVVVEDNLGHKFNATFFMEEDAPPPPLLISPEDGSKMGFMGKVAPTFQWGAVNDTSGISHYCLQIAKTEDFTELFFSVANIAAGPGEQTVSYELAKESALGQGSYYWRVKAVDRASNEGRWSATYSLRAGKLPLWAFIGIIILGVVLIGFLVYYFIIRKRESYYY